MGDSGTFKSEAAALLQQHYGIGMNSRNLPGSWSSTANALEMLAFHAKDALLVVDDFAPQGSIADIQRYHAAAERLFRAAGNHSSRGRLDSSSRLREGKPPRGLILSTGEEVPRGLSLRARVLVLEQEKGVISPADLSACQADAAAGLYMFAMAGFIQWFACDYDRIQAAFHRRAAELRTAALMAGAHSRTPDIVASLQAAFEMFLDFCVYCGAIGSSERDHLREECWAALREAARAQADHQTASDPTARFLSLVRSAMNTGRAHLRVIDSDGTACSDESLGWRREGQTWKPQGDCIGWVRGDDADLEFTAAYRIVQIMAKDVNEPFATSEQILKKRLHEKGLLASTDKAHQTLTVRRKISGTTKSVLHFQRETLLPGASDD